MRIQKQIQINAPASEVWEIVGHGFASVGEWASSVSHSAPQTQGRRVGGASCSGRVCETDLGPFRETITEYDDDRRIVGYVATGEKMPFFVRQLANKWRISSTGPNETVVEMDMAANLMKPFGLVMGPVMKLQMGKLLGNALEELKHFVETGAVHARKIDARQKAKEVGTRKVA